MNLKQVKEKNNYSVQNTDRDPLYLKLKFIEKHLKNYLIYLVLSGHALIKFCRFSSRYSLSKV